MYNKYIFTTFSLAFFSVYLWHSKFNKSKTGYVVLLCHNFTSPRQPMLTVAVCPSRGQECLWSLIKVLCSPGLSLASRGAATDSHGIRASGLGARNCAYSITLVLSLSRPGPHLEGQHSGRAVCDICSHSIDLTYIASELGDLIDSHQSGKVSPGNCWARTCWSEIMEKCPWNIQSRNQTTIPVYQHFPTVYLALG